MLYTIILQLMCFVHGYSYAFFISFNYQMDVIKKNLRCS